MKRILSPAVRVYRSDLGGGGGRDGSGGRRREQSRGRARVRFPLLLPSRWFRIEAVDGLSSSQAQEATRDHGGGPSTASTRNPGRRVQLTNDNPRFPDPGDEPFNTEPSEIQEAWGELKPIQTRYRGFLFRSRLEARWAVALDHLGIDYLYEPEGFELPGGLRYLPDFWLPVIRYWGEVKPVPLNPEDRLKATLLAMHSRRPVLELVGPPDFKPYTCLYPAPEMGVLVETASLDIDAHLRRYYRDERRLYASPDSSDLWEEVCSRQYLEAVFAARSARFERVNS